MRKPFLIEGAACEDEDDDEEEEEEEVDVDDSLIDRSTIVFFVPSPFILVPLVVDDDNDDEEDEERTACSFAWSSRMADNNDAGDKEVLPVANSEKEKQTG